MWLTKVRTRPLFNTNNIFQGDTKWVPINHNTDTELNYKYIDDLMDSDVVLYHFEFAKYTGTTTKNIEDKDISQYFGIMDIDIENCKNMSFQEFEDAKKKMLNIIVKELNTMGYKAYKIYFSGGKGFHVYIYDIKLWRIPDDDITISKSERLEWISQQVDILFPSLTKYLDKSIYRINNGIRAFTFPHPKKNTLNRLQYCSEESPVCHWTWISEKFKSGAPTKVKYIPSITPVTGTRQSTNNNNRTVIQVANGSLLNEARNICRGNQSNPLPSLIEKTNNQKTKLYVVDTKYCPIKKGDHSEKQKTYIIDHSISSGYVKIQCHKQTCQDKGHIIIKKKLNSLTCIYPLIQDLMEKRIITSTPKKVRLIPDNQKYISDQDIEFALEEGYGIISAPMGTGKTTALKTWLSKKPPEFKILLVVVRRTQAANFTGVYPGMVNYLETEGSLYDLNSSVVCINSLQRIRQENTGSIPLYDLLILDEIETILEGLINPQLSSAKSKQCDIWRLFKVLIYSSKRVLFMDGIPTENTIRYLDEIKVLGDCNLVEHNIQPDIRIYQNYYSITSFEESFEKDVRNKLKICFVSNTKSSLLLFGNKAKSCGAVDCLEITGDSNDQDKMTSSDPNNLWERDILAFNTAVGPGASFDNLHFDIMYVLVSPMSCSPFWMYQMINRIRKLSRNRVKMLVSWSEEKRIPTLEEYELQKAKNIVDMNWNQTKYPIPLAYFDTNGADNFMLDISPDNRHVIRKLVEENRLVLRHEDNHFLKTLSRYEHKKLTLNNTSKYSELLFEIIKRNGGIVKNQPDYSKEVTLKYIKTSTIMLKKDSNDYYNGIGVKADNCITKKLDNFRNDTQFMNYINSHVNLNDINTHINWSSFRRALTRSDISNYENELKSINDNSKALNNTLIYSNGLLESFRAICEILSLQINTATGIISGNSSVQYILQTHQTLNNHIEKIKNQIYNKNKYTGSTKNTYREELSLSRKNTAVFKNLKFAFQQLGIILIKSKPTQRLSNTGAVRESDARYSYWTFEVDCVSQHIRLALEGLAFDTGLRVENSVAYFKTQVYDSNRSHQ